MSEQIPFEDLLDYGRLAESVLETIDSPSTRRTYRQKLKIFFTWWVSIGRPELDRALILKYKAYLGTCSISSSTINLNLCAVRRLISEAVMSGVIEPIQGDAMLHVRGVKMLGVRSGTWLAREQAQALLEAPDCTTLKGVRDRAILAVLLGAGLRRSEAAGLMFGHFQKRDGRWAIIDLVGKGGRVRSVPIPDWVMGAVDAWACRSGLGAGRVFRAINKHGQLTSPMLSEQAIHYMVRFYSWDALGFSLSAHDLRRTYAKLARAGGAGLEQIQLSLGHESIMTTQRYLGTSQDFSDAPGDRLGLDLR